MTTLREAAQQALKSLRGYRREIGCEQVCDAERALEAALEKPERTLTDEVIADLWHANSGFHHHFARAIERWLKGQA
jgi:hypothetical protein